MDSVAAAGDNLQRVLDTIDQGLHDPNRPWHVLFGWAEARSGVCRLKLFVGLMVTVAAYMASGVGSMVLSDVIAFAYPAHATVEIMLRRSDTINRSDTVKASVKWFTYWLTFVAVLLVEQLCGALFAMLPYYCLIRTVFLAWCFAPMEFNGAAFVYAIVIRRYFAPSSANRNNDG